MSVSQIIWLLFLKSAVVTPLDEFRTFDNEGELSVDDHKFLMHIVPSGFSPKIHNKIKSLPNVANEDNEYFKVFTSYVDRGLTKKDLTFNIYDDKMRNAVVALYRYLSTIQEEEYNSFMEWAVENINKDMLSYATKVNYLYSNKINRKKITQLPCYVDKPNYFVNSETIVKALRIRASMNHGGDIPEELESNGIYKSHSFIVINTNYSGWNLPQKGGDEKLNYFREDVSLNCYYLGVHLMHPFWMSNDELDQINLRHAEHYYYLHKQLTTRYNLEKEHLRYENRTEHKSSLSHYNPYLVYDNGIPFPTRSSPQRGWNDQISKLKAIDIAIRECISRGLIVMGNGTAINLTEDTHINILAKLIRANLDNVKMAKIIRSLFGYGDYGYPDNEYNPAPSLLHHPETSLRDPIYWHMIQFVLDYFTDFKKSMELYDISQYETDEINIIYNNFTKIVTYFDYHQFPINKALNDRIFISKKWPMLARQRRLKHLPFLLNFTVESENKKDVVVRLFLGPKCILNCWQDFSNFYELDSYNLVLQEGLNEISWSPENSLKFSFYETPLDYLNPDSETSTLKKKKYNIYRFPGNLALPKGVEEGLNLTLFIMITPADDFSEVKNDSCFYREVTSEVDSKPLGFPFHRQATGFKDAASNYKFYSISIYHKRFPVDENGQFSSHLY